MNWYKILKLANRKEYLIKKLGIPKEIVDWAYDLSKQIEPKGIYIQWLSRLAQNNIIRPQEDDTKLLEKLKLFHKLKKIKKIDRTDINSFKTYGELAQYLEPFISEDIESKRGKEKRLETEGIVSMLKEGNVEIIRLDTEQSAANLCRNTEWCIKDPKYFREYKPPFYVFLLNNKPYALLHVDSTQFKDVYDDSINSKTIAPIIKSIEKFLEIYPGEFKGNYNYELAIIQEALRKKRTIQKVIESGNEQDVIRELLIDKNLYNYIDDEYRTENIKNIMVDYYNKEIKKILEILKDTNKDKNPGGYYEKYSTDLLILYENIPKDIIDKINPDYNRKIVELFKEKINQNTYSFSYLSDNLKSIMGKDNLINIVINNIKQPEGGITIIKAIGEELFNSIPKNILEKIINENIIPQILSKPDYYASEWQYFPIYFKNILTKEQKSKIALSFVQKAINVKYYTTGQYPSLHEDLLPFMPENLIIRAWEGFLEDMPDQYHIVPDNIKDKINIQSLVKGWMGKMSYHSINVYSKIPENIKTLIPIDYIKEKFKSNLIHTYSTFDSRQWNIIESVLSENEILSIILEYVNKIISVTGKDNIDITSVPEKYRQHIINYFQKQQNITQPSQSVVSFSKKWYKKAQNIDINTFLSEKYPQIDFFISEKNNTIILNKIIIPEELRNQNLGTSFVNDLIYYSKSVKKPIYLTPTGDYGGKVTKLREFYKNLGFKNRPKEDFSEKETMIRNE